MTHGHCDARPTVAFFVVEKFAALKAVYTANCSLYCSVPGVYPICMCVNSCLTLKLRPKALYKCDYYYYYFLTLGRYVPEGV